MCRTGGRGGGGQRRGEWIPARVTFAGCMRNSKRGAKGLRRDAEVRKVGPRNVFYKSLTEEHNLTHRKLHVFKGYNLKCLMYVYVPKTISTIKI